MALMFSCESRVGESEMKMCEDSTLLHEESKRMAMVCRWVDRVESRARM